MRRSQPIAALALLAALAAPPALAGAESAAGEVQLAVTARALISEARPLSDAPPSASALIAAAAPLTDVPVPQDAPSLTQTPLADGDGIDVAQAGPDDAGQLLAQAPQAISEPPAIALPYTGAELWLTVLLGGGMVLAGAGLRLHMRVAPHGEPAA